MTTLADFYSDLTTPAQLQQAGYAGASCYVSHQPGKNSLPGEILAFRNAGLIVALNFEDGATNALGGYTQGQADGAFARDCGLALGYPHGLIIFFSVDFDAASYQMPVIADYFRGVMSELSPYQTGVYGSYYVIEAMVAALGSGAIFGWQAEAWSGGLVSSHAALYQNAYGQQFDSDRVEYDVPIWGLEPVAVNKPNPAPAPAPKPTPKPPAPHPAAQFKEDAVKVVTTTAPSKTNTHPVFVVSGLQRGWLTTEPEVAEFCAYAGQTYNGLGSLPTEPWAVIVELADAPGFPKLVL